MTGNYAYLDHASSSPVRPTVTTAMLPYLSEFYGNPSSNHLPGRECRTAIDKARDRVSEILGADSDEIVFTSGATESIILSLIGAFAGNRHRGKHIIASKFEHHAVLSVFDFLREEMGAETEFVDIDRDGMVRTDRLESMIRPDTVLVSVMAVNNEIGTIQDIKTISGLCAERGILFHSDCVQAIGKIPVNLRESGIDLVSISGHKFGASKGVGIMYVRKGTYLKNICAGSHEFGMRAGTENTPGIVGISVAIEEAVKEREESNERNRKYINRLWEHIRSVATDSSINGSPDNTVQSILNVRIPGCVGEMLVLALDRAGVASSTASACQSGATEPSHVLSSMGLSQIEALSSLRLSLGWSTTDAEIDHFIEVFPEVYSRIKNSATVPTNTNLSKK
ncbi:MAG: cysteine desulfurase family protein [bacterium]